MTLPQNLLFFHKRLAKRLFLESGSSSDTAQEWPAKVHGGKRDLTENLLKLRNPALLCGEP